MGLDALLVPFLNGVSYGLLLFMLSAGLTLIFSMMGVLNFAHASLYMLGAYFAFSASRAIGYWPALLIAPVIVAALGALFERYCLRAVHRYGHVAELLLTFGLSYLLLEFVQLVWGRLAVPFTLPEELKGPLFTFHGAAFPRSRGFVALMSIVMLGTLWLVLARTRIGLVVRASLTHPEAAQTLGHNVPAIFTMVFALGAGLAGLAGVVGGSSYITEPAMAASVGPVVFVVVVVGGLGSLEGAFLAALLIGVVQNMSVALDISTARLLSTAGVEVDKSGWAYPLLDLSIAQVAPVMPFVVLIGFLIFRPRGLFGVREG